MKLDRAIELQLLSRATGPLCDSIESAFKSVHVSLKFDSRDPAVRPLAFAFIVQKRKILHAKLKDRRLGVSSNVGRATTDALKDPGVQAALRYLATKYKDRVACALLSRPDDIAHLYDGDAAQALLREYAYRCESPLREALFWLSMQDVARHAFAPKDDRGQPFHGIGDADLSRVPGTEVTAIERDYQGYLARRRQLLITDRNAQSRIKHSRERKLSSEFQEIDDESYVLSDEDEKLADKLWESEYAKLVTKGAAKTRLSELKKFGRRI